MFGLPVVEDMDGRVLTEIFNQDSEMGQRQITYRQINYEAEKIKEKMLDVVITISQKVGEESKLYGSVTSMDIAGQLEKQGIAIDRRKIALDKPIKTLGEFDVPVKLYPEVTGSIKVVVIPEE